MSDKLRLRLQGEVTLGQLREMAAKLGDLVTEVADEVPGAGREGIRWVISDASAGSLTIEVQARPSKEDVSSQAVEQVVTSITKGLAVVGQRPERPPYFNDFALEYAKDLAELLKGGITGIHVGDGIEQEASLGAQVIANIELIMGGRVETIGTVEGRLEGLLIHGRQVFSVYDSIFGRRYECNFGERISLEDVLAAFGKRVAARGIIRSRRGGTRATVEVTNLRVFAPEEELPSAEDVKGILRGES